MWILSPPPLYPSSSTIYAAIYAFRRVPGDADCPSAKSLGHVEQEVGSRGLCH